MWHRGVGFANNDSVWFAEVRELFDQLRVRRPFMAADGGADGGGADIGAARLEAGEEYRVLHFGES